MTENQYREEVQKIIKQAGLATAAKWFGLDSNSLARFIADQPIRNATFTVIKMKVDSGDRPAAPASKEKKASTKPAKKMKKVKKAKKSAKAA